MKKIDLGQTISILANVGVIAGIIFLAVELRQNNLLLESNARAIRTEHGRTLNLTLAENSELTSILVRARNGEKLTDVQREQLDRFYNYLIAGWNGEYREYANGLLSEEDLLVPLYRSSLSDPARYPGLLEYWDETSSGSMPADFVAFIEMCCIDRQ